ncbi:unnamed protein product [Sympodiomycopsis kandeliae]
MSDQEAGPSSVPLEYLDDHPNFESSLQTYSRIHQQTVDRIKKEHEREYRQTSSQNISGAHENESSPSSSSSSSYLASISSQEEENTNRRHRNDIDDVSDVDDDDDGEWSITTSEFEREQQEQWDEAMEQLQLAFKIIICPLFGKWMGRRWAYWAFTRYQLHGGLSLRFFGLSWIPQTTIPSWAVAAWTLIPGASI